MALRPADEPFTSSGFLRLKSKALMLIDSGTGLDRLIEVLEKTTASDRLTELQKLPPAAPKPKKIRIPADVKYPEIYLKLHAWRRDKMQELNVPAFIVMSDATMAGISNALPMTTAELQAVKGMGKTTCRRFGPEILTLITTAISEKS